MDDRFTGYDAASIAAYRLEGGKMLLRIDDRDPAHRRHHRGLRAGGQRARRPRPDGDGRAAAVPPRRRRRADACARTPRLWPAPSPSRPALGTTSAHTWLKMPSCDEPEVVFGATTLPCVVLGGVPGAGPGRGPGVLGPDARPADRARTRRGSRAALPARRRRPRRGGRGRHGPARCARGGVTMTLHRPWPDPPRRPVRRAADARGCGLGRGPGCRCSASPPV